MRAFVMCLAALTLIFGTTATAGPGWGKDNPANGHAKSAATTKSPADSAKPTAMAGASPALEAELEQMRKILQAQSEQLEAQRTALQEQQKRMAAMEEELRAARAASTGSAPESSASRVDANARTTVEASISMTSLSGNAPAAQVANQDRKSDSIELANGKIKIGALFYADYAFYQKTGFGPQFLTQINPPGPGNDNYNSFDLTRTYINFWYLPNDAMTFRVTPNIYREVGNVPGVGFGKNSSVASSANGNLSFRLKYAYLDFNKLFSGSEAFGKDKLTIGQQQNPLVDWEENLYGFRWVNLVNWNYLSLSSAQTGVSFRGPIEIGGKQYLDYAIGGFTNASFHAVEQSREKQGMGRVTVYPFAASSNLQRIGITAFGGYGTSNTPPDTKQIRPVYRVAGLLHYNTPSNNFGIAGEIDYGRNAFSSGNFFSGSGPLEQFTSPVTPSPFAKWNSLVNALLSQNGARQRGFGVFGHAAIPHTRFTLFGLYQYFLPNVNVGGKDPLDFERIVGGISYRVNSRLQFALDSQNLIFVHRQFTFPASQIALFSPSLAASNPSGIPNAVPQDTQSIVLNVEFNF